MRIRPVETRDFPALQDIEHATAEQFRSIGIAAIADLAATLRRQHKWKLPDAFQAALAQTHKLKLATRNTKDFPSRHDFVEIPYEL